MYLYEIEYVETVKKKDYIWAKNLKYAWEQAESLASSKNLSGESDGSYEQEVLDVIETEEEG